MGVKGEVAGAIIRFALLPPGARGLPGWASASSRCPGADGGIHPGARTARSYPGRIFRDPGAGAGQGLL